MKKTFITLLSLLFASITAFSQEKKNIDVADFESIAFAIAGKLTVEQGKKFKVTLESNKDALDKISVEVKNGKLRIKNTKWKALKSKSLKAYVSLPVLEGLSVSGSGYVVNKGNIECDGVSLGISGSGKIELDTFTADRVKISISGSGGVMLNGSGADQVSIAISGSGGVSAVDFEIDKATVAISGSGKCKLWVSDALKAKISGSGDVYVKGDPNIDSKSSGSGKVRKF